MNKMQSDAEEFRIVKNGKEYLFGDTSYLPAPHGQGRGTLESDPPP